MDSIAIDRINNYFDFDKMHNEIKNLINVAWNSAISISQLDSWLDNFNGEFLGDERAEKNLALNLLQNYTYYTEEEVKHFCKVIFDLYIHQKLYEYKNEKKHETLNDAQKELRIINNTKFISLGIPSESGGLVLYWFREANDLPRTAFRQDDNEPENLVVIDDVSMTGSQAVRYLEGIKNIESRKMYFLCFLCTEEAEAKIKEAYQDITIISASKIYDYCKAFSDNSVFFGLEDEKFKELTKDMFTYYGKKTVKDYPTPDNPFMEEYPLGYGDSQQLFGFFYNTPNNTIPLIWINNQGWIPLFKRHEKKYSSKIEVNNNEKFL